MGCAWGQAVGAWCAAPTRRASLLRGFYLRDTNAPELVYTGCRTVAEPLNR